MRKPDFCLFENRRGGSNEYPQSMFWSKNKKNRYTPAYPSFAILKWGSRGYTLHGHVFLMLLFCTVQPRCIQTCLQIDMFIQISLGDSTLSFYSGSKHFFTMYIYVYLFDPRSSTIILQLITMVKQIHNDKSHHADSKMRTHRYNMIQ